jgi:hypothetical protein
LDRVFFDHMSTVHPRVNSRARGKTREFINFTIEFEDNAKTAFSR